jgi:hypothetical protein
MLGSIPDSGSGRVPEPEKPTLQTLNELSQRDKEMLINGKSWVEAFSEGIPFDLNEEEACVIHSLLKVVLDLFDTLNL